MARAPSDLRDGRAEPWPFFKMHGCGNDFVVLDARSRPLSLAPATVAALADRRTGIGFDQLIVLEPTAAADVFMRIYNADGTEAGACGNATRCVARLLGREHGLVRTVAGLLPTRRIAPDQFEVDMGPPVFDWRGIPLAREADTLHPGLPGDPAVCSMGNPHATLFVPDIDAAPVATAGPSMERDPLFAERANIGFAQVLGANRIRLRVWERGAGLTRACGSGACAALVNAHRRGLTGRRATVLLDGGALDIVWLENDHVTMAGPATLSFTGSVVLD